MFGRQRPVTFDPYGRRRRRRVPTWLWLLLLGTATGAGGVLFVQERYLPPRLSADASSRLQAAHDRAEAERARLQRELDTTATQLKAALADQQRLTQGLAESRAAVGRLEDDLTAVVDALPPSPRSGTVEVRAARFAARAGKLEYDLVLTRERSGAGDKPMPGLIKLVVAGESGTRAGESQAALQPIALTIGPREVLRGSVPLPDGFRPRQTTVQVLDKSGSKLLGMRVINVG